MTAAAIIEVRSAAPDLAELPDDVATWMLLRYGPDWLDMMPVYRGLARSRGMTLLEVLDAASRDQLADVVRQEARDAR